MSELNPGASPVHDLIRQREQLNGWIARLDEVGGRASTHVTQRVRADYADRLRRVTEDLSSHRGEIEADLERNRGLLQEAEERRGHLADEMDEVQLRHLIGELDEAAWDAQRPGLESAVAEAGDAVAHARSEVERLQTLAADIAGAESAMAAPSPAPAVADAPPPAVPIAVQNDWETEGGEPLEASALAPDDVFAQPADPVPATPAQEIAPPASLTPAETARAADEVSSDEWDPFGGEFGEPQKMADADEELPWLEGIDEAAKAWTPPAAAPAEEDNGLDFLRDIENSVRAPETTQADLGADDLAFLEELDRAIGAPAPAPSSTPSTPSSPSSAPSGGSRAEPLLCKECGAINEPHSWYCEICGSEL
ncbi:zinc finger Ran-binding domain-containing protein [Longimicrobium terrae]|uniref:Uncharacterized protein n=1 Tax=Longimicrobium terrae TaxID=1639882 RepID=A0A841GSX5_9BACT|nr:Ran-binding zinc finger domain-containing protein [Longimicrobium terrae]MBB4635135.1 hypothetical protein [Longimicrobium terrae]MBB6069529.1 hypothetical protein [Longimicrobium terrae]NNC31669.1 hypothetical protein [Longimicrobium terrae]